MSTVRIKQSDLPPLTVKRQKKLRELAALPDTTIDLSDIPQLSLSAWRSVAASPFYRPIKTSTTIRVDSDVLAWLRRDGRGYQTRLNGILREAMLKEHRAVV